MKLHTLIEYCLLIFCSGAYFAFLGFRSNGLTFIIGVIILYIIINFSTKKILPRYHLDNKKMSVLISVLSIIGTVFITMLILTILVT
ncbi:hypothetical protein [Metabacillus sp. FJAT-53654]|uniref:DUF4181 domain-containing protein n=1 Tax=Metabacillus rhizosphaerae TaxID=3117747 RepID=A0ABZ2MQI7_9BACI